MDVLLSSSLLSKNFITDFSARYGPSVRLIALNELKRKNLFAFIWKLREQKVRNVYIASEDNSAPVTFPIMQVFSYLVGAQKIFIIDAQLRARPYPRYHLIQTILSYSASSVLSFFDLFCITIRLFWLSILKRDDRFTFEEDSIIYLKSNLWFGVKAGGSVGHIAGVINAFLRKKWKVNFVSTDPPAMISGKLNFFTVLFPRSYIYPTDLNNIVYDRILTRKTKEFAKISRFKGFIYQRMSVFNTTGVVLSRSLKRPLVLEYNGSEVWVSANWGRPSAFTPIARISETICLRHAHKIVTVSDVLKQELISRGVDAERIIVYPNCIDADKYDNEIFTKDQLLQKRREFSIEPADRVITFIGTFGMWHGVDVLAQAIKKLVDHYAGELDRLRIKFLLVGDGYMMPQVKELIGASIYAKWVIFTGLRPQGEGPIILSLSDILLSPHKANEDGSRFFGSPTKLFEYMGVRKPIIASDLEQLGEVISPALRGNQLSVESIITNEVGILCEPGDVEELSRAILQTAARLPDLSSLGENARKKVVNQYTWDHHVDFILTKVEKFRGEIRKTKSAKTPDIKALRSIPYFQIGPFPPPYGGVSVFVQRYSQRLSKRYKVRIFDTSRISFRNLMSLFVNVILNPRFFILHLNSMNLLALSLLKLRFFPFYLRVQDHSERRLESYGAVKRAYLSFLMRGIDELVLVGPHLRDYYLNHEISFPDKVRVRPPFLPPPLSEEAKIISSYPDNLRSFLKEKHPIVIMNAYKIIFSNDVDLYGFDMSIELLKTMVKKYPNAGMIFALADASDSKQLEKIKTKIEKSGLKENSCFLVNQKQIWPLFRHVDLMIRPTYRDGFGISVAEALYFGCPAIASDACLRPEGTILFKARDQKDLNEKALSVLNKKVHLDKEL